jgi:hypothetical protein
MTNYYNNGLYLEPFFTKHKYLELDYGSIHQELIDSDDFHLYAEYYNDDLDGKGEDDLREQVVDLVLEKISYWATYFEPLIFNKKIALECSLTPFIYKGTNLLALSGCGMDLSPRLDAYQALTDNTIDKGSRLFSDNAYFEHVVGSSLAAKVKQAISYDLSINKTNEGVEVIL